MLKLTFNIISLFISVHHLHSYYIKTGCDTHLLDGLELQTSAGGAMAECGWMFSACQYGLNGFEYACVVIFVSLWQLVSLQLC